MTDKVQQNVGVPCFSDLLSFHWRLDIVYCWPPTRSQMMMEAVMLEPLTITTFIPFCFRRKTFQIIESNDHHYGNASDEFASLNTICSDQLPMLQWCRKQPYIFGFLLCCCGGRDYDSSSIILATVKEKKSLAAGCWSKFSRHVLHRV